MVVGIRKIGGRPSVQADGKIVVAGDHSGYTEASTNGLIARYHGYADVRPDIKVNGADGGVVVSPGDAIEATIALDPGPRVGEDAVWWVLADTPSGLRTYDFATGSWLSGASPGYRGPLVPVSGLTVFAGLAPSSGPVRLYFAVQVRGGAGGPELPYSDELGVTVTP